MADEAGGLQTLEKQLEEWAIDAEFREMTQTKSTSWETADRLALALLKKT